MTPTIKLTPSQQLQLDIKQLSFQQQHLVKGLKEEVHVVIESLEPVQLVKYLFDKAASSIGLRSEAKGLMKFSAIQFAANSLVNNQVKQPFLRVIGVLAGHLIHSVVAKKAAELTDK
jgi:hypothetical protein